MLFSLPSIRWSPTLSAHSVFSNQDFPGTDGDAQHGQDRVRREDAPVRVCGLQNRGGGRPHGDGGEPPTVRCTESFNASGGKKTLKQRLVTTKADILLAQEIGHLQDQQEALTSWASGRGWRMLGLPSYPTSGVLPGAGVAVFTRDGHGLRKPDIGDMKLWVHRIQHVVVDIDSLPSEHHIVNM